jgi:hypothetical protein
LKQAAGGELNRTLLLTNTTVLIIITAKTRQENEETANHPRTAMPKGRHRTLVCSQKTVRKGHDAVRRSLRSRNYKTGGICRQKGRSNNTDCQNTPEQHQLSSVTDSYSWMPEDRSTERNKINKGQQSRENNRKMAREEDTWTIAT